MKKNLLLSALIVAVAVANTVFFLSEKDYQAELKVDDLESLAFGENYGGFWAEKDYYCVRIDIEDENESPKLTKHECSGTPGSGCENEKCPEGWKRQTEHKRNRWGD